VATAGSLLVRAARVRELRGRRGGPYDAAMDRLKIPPLALLGLCFVGCKEEANPIVGTWDAAQIGDMMFPSMLEEVDYTFSVDLIIAEDLTGSYNIRVMYQAYDSVDSYDLTVDDSAAPKYTIAIPSAELTLNCTLSGSQLACTDQEAIEYRFKKR
jgi:hypothetical protein